MKGKQKGSDAGSEWRAPYARARQAVTTERARRIRGTSFLRGATPR
jgi:hypothetical protein